MRWFLFRGRRGCELLVVPGSDPQAGLWDSGGENHIPAHTPRNPEQYNGSHHTQMRSESCWLDIRAQGNTRILKTQENISWLITPKPTIE